MGTAISFTQRNHTDAHELVTYSIYAL